MPEPTWRTGGCWGNTIVAQGSGEPDPQGHRQGDRLVGMATRVEDAERIVAAVNAHEPDAAEAPMRIEVHTSLADPEAIANAIRNARAVWNRPDELDDAAEHAEGTAGTVADLAKALAGHKLEIIRLRHEFGRVALLLDTSPKASGDGPERAWYLARAIANKALAEPEASAPGGEG